MVSAVRYSNGTTAGVRTAGAQCQRRVVRPGFRRCPGNAGRAARRSLAGKSCLILNARRALIAGTIEVPDEKHIVLPNKEDSVSENSPDDSIHARVSACLDIDARAASAAAGLLSRINAAKLGNGATNLSTEQRQSQDAQARAHHREQLDDSDRAAAAAAKFLERVNGAKARICKLADEIPRRSRARHVKFDMSALETYEVIPYCEIYGMHPREFVFSKDYHMLPAAPPHGFVGMESTSDDDEDSDASSSDDEWA